MLSISPFSIEHMAEAAALAADEPQLISRLRWHSHTPYACALAARWEGVLAGFAFGITHAGSGMVHDVFVYPTYFEMGIGSALARRLLSWMEQCGCSVQVVVAPPGMEGFWSRFGFERHVGLLRYEHGTFVRASRAEVVALEPPHLLAVARLDQLAFGEERAEWLREHAGFGSAYVEGTRVRGFALPLPANGLIVADGPDVGLELQRWLLPTHEGLTLPVGNLAAHAHLVARKYAVSEAGTRMVRGVLPAFRVDMVFAHP
jgi:GNAT superfamily N-acetyltransferase